MMRGSRARPLRLLLPTALLALVGLAAGRTAAAGPALPGACWLLRSSQAAQISGGGLSLLEQHCAPSPPASPAAPAYNAASPSALPQPGANVRVNDPSTDTPPFTTQNETTIKACGGTILAAFNDSGSINHGGFTGYARSTDNGDTWTDLGNVARVTGSDPALAADRNCRFYFAALTVIGPCSTIGIARSDDGGLTWSNVTNISPSTPCNDFQDKEWIAVDTTTGPDAGNVYTCWDDRATSQVRTLFARSVDGGQSFSAPVVISSVPAGFATGCHIAVAPDGGVHVVWTNGFTLALSAVSSADGGISFSPPVTVHSTQLVGEWKFCSGGAGDLVATELRPVLNGDIRAFNWPAFAVNPLNGHLHVAWNDNSAGNPDILWSRSTDGGQTWSAPRRLNDDSTTTDQFQPDLAFADNGVLRAIWYDRRLDPANNLNIDVYSTTSVNDGDTFSANERITDVSFGVPPLNPPADPATAPCYMGDYIGVAGAGAFHYMLWGDNRNLIDGHPDPDVYFARRSASGVELTVTRTDDPPPGACTPGDCSLREAIIAANQAAGPATVHLPAGHYTLSIPGVDEEASATGDLNVGGSVTIIGAGADLTTIDAQQVDRVLEIKSGATAFISGVSITGGQTVGVPGGGGADGGGIANHGALVLDAVAITGNTITRAGSGGGIASDGSLTITRSLVSGNQAALDGGGIFAAGSLTVRDSTVSGNSAALGGGGGIMSLGQAVLAGVTLDANRSSSGPAAAGSLENGPAGSLKIRNSIVAGGTPLNCAGAVTSLGHNIEDADTCGFQAAGDRTGADPLLQPLADNGGPTLTQALSAAGPAVDTGDPAACSSSDQRGFIRPVDGDNDGKAVCDIGAFELGSVPMGDVNCDRSVNTLDALAILRFAAQLGSSPPCLALAGDVNCDGAVDTLDALDVLREAAGFFVSQPPACPPLGGP